MNLELGEDDFDEDMDDSIRGGSVVSHASSSDTAIDNHTIPSSNNSSNVINLNGVTALESVLALTNGQAAANNNNQQLNSQQQQQQSAIATQAAAAVAATLAAQQLLVCAAQICDNSCDLGALTNFAQLAVQSSAGQNNLGQNNNSASSIQTAEQLMAAAVAAAAFLSPNHLMTTNNQQQQQQQQQQLLLQMANYQQQQQQIQQQLHQNQQLHGLATNLTPNNNNIQNLTNQGHSNGHGTTHHHSSRRHNNNNNTSNNHHNLNNNSNSNNNQTSTTSPNQILLTSNNQNQNNHQSNNHLTHNQHLANVVGHLDQHHHHHPNNHQHHHHHHQQQQQHHQQAVKSEHNSYLRDHHISFHHLGGHHHSSIQTQQQLMATRGYNPLAVVGDGVQTVILTPIHLRKAKLMFFYVRYPQSATLKDSFRDVQFNKNNTAQLVKWFSNFREFYYIQMEKYARDAIKDQRIQRMEDIVVGHDHELINQLNNHYNKGRAIELPDEFRRVVEETLRHFFDAIHQKRDQEQSWKKAIYKIIARLDCEVPELFKSREFDEILNSHG